MWTLPPDQAKFDATPKTGVFAPTGGWGDKITVPWIKTETIAVEQHEPAYRSDENLKKKYGIELAKAVNAFEAACILFEDTSQALWVSVNWLADPTVIASKDVYSKTVALSVVPLDREQTAAKVLAIAEEKILKNGVLLPAIEAKDRIAALKLYSDILQYTGKVDIDASTKTFTHNEMTIKFVKPEVKELKTVSKAPNVKSEILNEEQPLISLKLVGGSSA